MAVAIEKTLEKITSWMKRCIDEGGKPHVVPGYPTRGPSDVLFRCWGAGRAVPGIRVTLPADLLEWTNSIPPGERKDYWITFLVEAGYLDKTYLEKRTLKGPISEAEMKKIRVLASKYKKRE